MISVTIPEKRQYCFQHLVLDMNGTLSIDGVVQVSTMIRLKQLTDLLNVYVITSDTFGTAEKTFAHTSIQVIVLHGEAAPQKKAFVEKLNPVETISIGNGYNDVTMLERADLSICVIGQEGAASKALFAADIVVNNINDALDLLILTDRLRATLRG